MILGLASIIGLGLAFFFVKSTPSETAARFMDALVRSDRETLVELSHIPDATPEQLDAKWKKTLEIAKNYAFQWQMTSQSQNSDTSAVAFLVVMPDMNNPQSFEQKIQLPMVLIDGKWKVDVRRIPRDVFPALPR